MSDYLPAEFILEIFGRLPVKSLMRFRSVCKTWNSLINNPSFISTHLETVLSKPNSKLLLLRRITNYKENYFFPYHKNYKQKYFLHYDNDGLDEFKQLHFPVKICLPYSTVVGSCNGLVCLRFLQIDILYFILWNLSIQKYITLPKPSINGCSSDTANVFFGFGFDSRANDYKLLIVVGESSKISNEAHLFSLNGNSWKRVTAMFPEYAIAEEISSNTFVNGAVHWVGYRRSKDGGIRNTVLGFDISTEDFLVIRLPKSLMACMDLSIMKYEESSIAVLERSWKNGPQLDMWVMKEYGVVGSWTKAFHFSRSGIEGLPWVLGFRMNGEVLLQLNGIEMASLDLNCREMQPLGIMTLAPSVDTYVESLVLLDKGASFIGSGNHSSDSDSSE